jgi:hypothetical protein
LVSWSRVLSTENILTEVFDGGEGRSFNEMRIAGEKSALKAIKEPASYSSLLEPDPLLGCYFSVVFHAPYWGGAAPDASH